MEPECTHPLSSFCAIPTLSEEEKQAIKDHVNAMTDEQRKHYIGSCRVIKPYKAAGRFTKHFIVEYYLKNFGSPTLRVCQGAFLRFFNKSRSVVNRENLSLFNEGIIVDRRTYNKPLLNQYGLPITEEEWLLLEQWIRTNVPRKKVPKGDQWIICDEQGEPLTHRQLLAMYNDFASKHSGFRQFSMENWKKCWYTRMRLKNKWKFKLRNKRELSSSPPPPPLPEMPTFEL